MKHLARRIERLEQRDAPETVELLGVPITRAAIADMLRDITRSPFPITHEEPTHEGA